MNKELLSKHVARFVEKTRNAPDSFKEKFSERVEQVKVYQTWTKERLCAMNEGDLHKYIKPLWAMLMWGNKEYAVNRAIKNNGMDKLRNNLADLVWGNDLIGKRWDRFRDTITNIGPAMMSEILCKTHPEQYALWNRRAYIGLHYLGVEKLPRHSYQITGAMYERICKLCQEIAKELQSSGYSDHTLLAVDYFIYEELQDVDNPSSLGKKGEVEGADQSSTGVDANTFLPEPSKFVHNDTRDMLRDIGQWLGFDTATEKKIAAGAVVDTLWEAKIGNMGRITYVFEVQTRGNIDSLLVNLQKAMNNPAVQGVVAVSDAKQLEKIRAHSHGIPALTQNLKFWDYEEVAKIHEALSEVNESINKLGLVPEGF